MWFGREDDPLGRNVTWPSNVTLRRSRSSLLVMTDDQDPDDRLSQIETVWRHQRRRMLDIGYRMLGSVTEAEDVTSEAYLRLLAADLDAIDDIVGWLVAVTGRLCVDRLRSSDLRRRAYVGPWLPEPIVNALDHAAVDPADRVTLDDSIKMALLVVLEQLSPAERTAFVLHDMFGVAFEEIGAIVGRSPAACRQLASRARRRIQSDPETPRATVSRAELERVAQRFADACTVGSIDALIDVLDPEVVGDFDSGGLVPGAPLDAIAGATNVARVLTRAFGQRTDFTFDVMDVNGDPGVVVSAEEQVVAVIALSVKHERVAIIHAVGHAGKLAHLQDPEVR